MKAAVEATESILGRDEHLSVSQDTRKGGAPEGLSPALDDRNLVLGTIRHRY